MKQLKHSKHADETLAKNTMQHPDQNACSMSREILFAAISNQSYCNNRNKKRNAWYNIKKLTQHLIQQYYNISCSSTATW